MVNVSLYNYSDAYIYVEERIIIVGQSTDVADIEAGRNNEEVVFKNCTPFIQCITKTNNSEVDNAEDLDIVMPMCNLL